MTLRHLPALLISATALLLTGCLSPDKPAAEATTVQAPAPAPAPEPARPAEATGRQIDLHLTAKPQLTEEGIHFQTAEGQRAMYAMRASEQVYRAFEQARAGQCLRLHVSADFDFNDAEQISRVTDCR